MAEEDEDAEPAPGTFKVDDLNKMHTYRDAIGGASFAVAAYPGHESRLFPQDPEQFACSGGVGAVALRPDARGGGRGFAEVVRRVVENAITQMETADPSAANR